MIKNPQFEFKSASKSSHSPEESVLSSQEEHKEKSDEDLVKNTRYRTVLGMFKRRIVKSVQEKELYDKISRYISLSNQMKYIDLATSLIDFVTIAVFYNDHFEYIDNYFVLSTSSNILRWVLLGTSVLISIGLFYRRTISAKLKKILLELSYKEKIVKHKAYKLSYVYLALEITLHILQPYPYLVYKFEMEIVGNIIIYTLNMILYFLSTLRSYYFIKVIRYWNLYSTERSKRILEYFDKESNSDMFLYKANLDHRGFITLSLLGVIVVVYFSLLLKVLEYDVPDLSNPFENYINNIWYLIVTMATIGYGDITPQTVLGRIVGVLVCLLGVVILSLLVVTLTMFTYLDSDELVAFNTIKSLSTSESMQLKIDSYIKKIILARIKYKFQRIDLECITDKYHRTLEKVECSLELHKQKKSKNIHNEFIGNMRDISEKNLDSLFKGFTKMWDFEDILEKYLVTNDQLCLECQESKNTMIRCLNLARCLVIVGSVKNIKSIDEIQHKKAFSSADLNNAKYAFLSDSKSKLRKHETSINSQESEAKEMINYTTIQKNEEIEGNEGSERSSQHNDIIFQDFAALINHDNYDGDSSNLSSSSDGR